MKAIINARLYDYVNYHELGYMIYDERIHEIGPMNQFKYNMETYDVKGQWVIPGLINFHTHIYSSLFRGFHFDVSPQSFQELLEKIWWKYDDSLKLEDIGMACGAYCFESLRSGVTAIVDHHASGEIKGSLNVIRNVLKGHFGMKGMFSFETSDRYHVPDCLDENRDAVQLGDGILGLHASMSLSDETLSACSEEFGQGPIHVHLAESDEDEADAMDQYGITATERFHKHGLLNKGSILAHCVHINEKEAQLISQQGAIVALNPSSNMNNAVGISNLSLMKKWNIPVVVGTDGLGANIAKEWLNVYFLNKLRDQNSNGIPLDSMGQDLVSSYELFNHLSGSQIGLFKEGYDADFMVVDYKSATPVTKDNVFAHIFFGIFDSLRPRDVFVQGNKKIKNYEPTIVFDFNEELVKGFWKRIGGKNEIKS